MLTLLTSLCGSLCFWSAPEPAQELYANPDLGAYHASVKDRPVLRLDSHILIAPLERYTQRLDGASPWWNASYFGLDREGMAQLEKGWQSPLLAANHQFLAGGGRNGMAITYSVQGQPACLLEQSVLARLDALIAEPNAHNDDHQGMFLAWHEYGHCAYHSMRGGQMMAATRPALDARERYQIELFADTYAQTQMWVRHNLDATGMIAARRSRGLALSGDITHWTVPALKSWRDYLAKGGDDQPIQTLFSWITTHDWTTIRDEQLAAQHQ